MEARLTIWGCAEGGLRDAVGGREGKEAELELA